jgi:hypothetical protein
VENNDLYLYHHKIQLVKVVQIIQDLESEGWMYILSFVLLEDTNLHHDHPTIRIRMLKNSITKWVFVDAYANCNFISE